MVKYCSKVKSSRFVPDTEWQLSSLVTPSGRLDIDSSKFPSVKIPRFVSGGLTEIQEGVNGAEIVAGQETRLTWTCTHTTSNFAPNKYRGVVNSSGLAVYKGSTQEIKSATESKLRV